MTTKRLNKENVQPLQFQKQNAEKQQQQQQQQREAEEEAARRQKEAAAVAAVAEAVRLHQEIERSSAERALHEEAERRKAEEAARLKALQRAAAERAREEKTARYAFALAVEEDRQRSEAARAAQEQAWLTRKEAEEKVNVWCKSNGYQDMNTQKKTLRGATKFPLHTAVKNNNPEIVAMMLTTGVHKDVRDSNNQSPSQMAAKLNMHGSHSQILIMLL